MLLDTSKYYLLYDGDCGLCNRWVQWVLKHDEKDQFRFMALQSEYGQQFLKERGLPLKDFDSLYLWKPQAFYLKKSDAVIKIGSILGGKFHGLSVGKLIPQWVRNKLYDMVAKRRMNLMSPSCYLPTPEERQKFL